MLVYTVLACPLVVVITLSSPENQGMTVLSYRFALSGRSRQHVICRLPGTPLGNTGLSWSDVLLGNLPNVYIYAGASQFPPLVGVCVGV